MVFAEKKETHELRPYFNYSRLNDLTEPDAYSLPKIDDLLERLTGATYFTKMDLTLGYHQIPIHKESIPLTAFNSPQPIRGYTHFEWIRMPFGLINASAEFQRMMDIAFNGLQQEVLVYMDDLLILSFQDPEDQINICHTVCDPNHGTGTESLFEKMFFPN